ncbi:hypothetical protein K439DRAFT_954380 [Ramaria rubella]|nr:hypothetical protein K439DRAFT_954380 [Ramaria rubella]
MYDRIVALMIDRALERTGCRHMCLADQESQTVPDCSYRPSLKTTRLLHSAVLSRWWLVRFRVLKPAQQGQILGFCQWRRGARRHPTYLYISTAFFCLVYKKANTSQHKRPQKGHIVAMVSLCT